jgi:hypothetical protein
MALPDQLGGQAPGRLRGPPQRRHRVALLVRLHQTQQGRPQSRVQVRGPLAASAAPEYPPQRCLAGIQFSHPARDSAFSYSGCAGHEPDPAMAQRPRLRSYRQTALPFIEVRQQRLELRSQGRVDPLRSPCTTTTSHRDGSDGLFSGKP